MLFNSYDVVITYPGGRPEGYFINASYYNRSKAVDYAMDAWEHACVGLYDVEIVVTRINWHGEKQILRMELHLGKADDNA